MIKPGALILAAAMAAVSAGTYFGLGMLPPGVLPPPIGRNPPPAAHMMVAENTVTASAPAAAAAPAEAAPAPAAQPAATPTEQDLAEEPAPKPVEHVAQADPQPTPAPAQAKPEPKAEPAPAPKEEAPAPAEKPKATAKAVPKAAEPAATETSEAPAPVTPAKPRADSDAIKQWWPEPSKLPATQMKLMYAGDVQGVAAIGLLFGSVPNMDSLKLHAHVRDVSGADVGGTWEPGKNPQLVVYRGLKAGRYTVILDKELSDAQGFALGQTLQGAVYITPK